MKKRLVLYGGSMNPPTDAHVATARQLHKRFDRTVVALCGLRPDKWSVNAIDPLHRAIMARAAFRGTGVEVDFSDLDRDGFQRTIDLDRAWKERLGNDWEVWHAVGTDLIKPGDDRLSRIQREWSEGPRVWSSLNFAVVPRPGYPIKDDDLPPHRILLPDLGYEESSSAAREAFARGEFDRIRVPSKVKEHVRRYGLYAWAPGSRREGRLFLPPVPRLAVIPDARNPRACGYASVIKGTRAKPGNADAVVAIGGDGHMLDVIRTVHPSVPVIGINAGHRGFLLSDGGPDAFNRQVANGIPFEIQLLPLLRIDIQRPDGTWMPPRYAFNEALADQSGTGAAWISFTAEGRKRRTIDRIVCDKAAVSTSAGSTGHTHSMGAPIQQLHTQLLTFAAEGVCDPRQWQNYVTVTDDSVITIECLDPRKRPICAVLDGKIVGRCVKMIIRLSRVEGVNLAFLDGHSLADKIADFQFPSNF